MIIPNLGICHGGREGSRERVQAKRFFCGMATVEIASLAWRRHGRLEAHAEWRTRPSLPSLAFFFLEQCRGSVVKLGQRFLTHLILERPYVGSTSRPSSLPLLFLHHVIEADAFGRAVCRSRAARAADGGRALLRSAGKEGEASADR